MCAATSRARNRLSSCVGEWYGSWSSEGWSESQDAATGERLTVFEPIVVVLLLDVCRLSR